MAPVSNKEGFFPRRMFVGLILPVGLTVLLFVIATFFIAIPTYRDHLIDARRQMSRELNHTAWQLIEDYYQRHKAGELTEVEAQRRALERVRSLRYGPEGKDYFWINDMQHQMIMHPYRTDLEGVNVKDYQDETGLYLFQAFVDTVKRHGSGFVEYYWQWKDDTTRTARKISYIKEFEPWGWILGTGVYVEDVYTSVDRIIRQAVYGFGTFLVMIIALSAVVIHYGMRTEKERLLALDSLQESEEKYRSLFENSRDAIYMRNPEGVLLDVNAAFAEMVGRTREELIGTSIDQLYFQPVQREAFEQKLWQDGAVRDYPLTLMHRDGSVVEALISTSVRKRQDGSTIEYQGIIRDITEQKSIEKQMLQAQKMEAVGRLAGGIAHDFNNLLTVIIGFTELAQFRLSEDDSAYENLEQILKVAGRASNLTRQLLAFSRQQHVQPRVLNPGDLLKDMTKMLHRILGETVEFALEIEGDIRSLKIDPSQFEQIVVNMVVNACDAMPAGGRLTISLRNQTLEREFKTSGGTARPGSYVRLDVADTGTGIPENIQSTIFEPFFTTKEEGKGTGLGLSTVFGIVSQNEGLIWLDSTLQVGTTFHILMPVTEEEDDGRSPAQVSAMDLQGQETIVLVEDDHILHELLLRVLQRNGYRVFSSDNSNGALEIIDQRHDEIDLLLTDVVMPGLPTQAYLEALADRFNPGEILFISGYMERAESLKAFFDQQPSCMQKPFTPTDLLRKVREVLDRKLEKTSAATSGQNPA
ncbi:PAS domain S-box protein [bacterium]|nr:PAS domain S-box protein [bacterium]